MTQLEVKKLLAAQQARGEEVDRAHRACEEAKAAAREMAVCARGAAAVAAGGC